MYIKITYKVGEEQHSVVISEDEDGKKVLRQKLNLKRLPNGVEKLSVKDVPLEEISTEDLKRFLSEEEARHKRLVDFYENNKDMGTGWLSAINSAKRLVDNIQLILAGR